MDKSKITERIVAQLVSQKSAGVKEDYDVEISGRNTGRSVHINLWMVFKDPNNFNRTRHYKVVKSMHKILLETVNEEIENNQFFEISDDFWNVSHKIFTGECVVIVSEVEKNMRIEEIFMQIRRKLKSLL